MEKEDRSQIGTDPSAFGNHSPAPETQFGRAVQPDASAAVHQRELHLVFVARLMDAVRQ
jgi:hypothetical protein